MFDTTFFKFLIAFIVIVGLSSVVIGFVGGINNTPPVDSRTAQPAQ